MAVNQVSVNCLGQDVGRVLPSRPLQECEVSGADALLHPQLGYCKVPNPTGSSARANSDRRATVGTNFKGGSETQ
eukprot:7200495-Alexandrium_andersonii.AAC.1